MHPICKALVQLSWLGRYETMMDTYHQRVHEATSAGAELVCLLELSILLCFPRKIDNSGFGWTEVRA